MVGARARSSAKAYHLVCDNTAVCGALKRGYSTNTRATSILESFPANTPCNVVSIVSEDNVADTPSRGGGIEERRRAATTICVADSLKGIKTGEPKRHPNIQGTGEMRIRHVEGIDDDLILDVLPVECLQTTVPFSTPKTIPKGSTTRRR
jgi:hypothetical protein